MDQATCGRLIEDWFAMRGIKADAVSLAAWLYAGGDTIRPQTPPRPTYQWLFDHVRSAVRDVATWPAWKRNATVPPAIPKLGPYGEGYAAWHASKSLNAGPHGASPYTTDSDEDEEWIDGWRAAELDNGQFGVGA